MTETTRDTLAPDGWETAVNLQGLLRAIQILGDEARGSFGANYALSAVLDCAEETAGRLVEILEDAEEPPPCAVGREKAQKCICGAWVIGGQREDGQS